MKKGGNPQNLNRGGTPGNKGGTGRPPDWFKAECSEYLQKYDLFGFVGRVARGDDFEQGVGQEGEIIKIPASIKDRLRAVEMLKEWGVGKTPTPIEHSGNIDMNAESAKSEIESGVNAYLSKILAVKNWLR